jgi:predicted O-methyltransferase YrrM
MSDILDKFKSGAENPEKVPPYLLHKLSPIGYYYHEYIRSRGATIYQYDNKNMEHNLLNEITSSFFSDFELNNKQQKDFNTYLKLSISANYYNCQSILEIGAGFSTAIWAEYASRMSANVTSIDADFKLLEQRTNETQYERLIDEQVNLIEGVSVVPEKIAQFYSEPQTELGGVPVSKFKSNLDIFARAKGCPITRIEATRRSATKRDWSLSDVLISNEAINFPENILQLYMKSTSIEEYTSELKTNNNKGVIQDATNSTSGWDLIWFDSGELSSVIEWSILKEYVNPGGIVGFHDIFYPKSMKNFLIAASLISDPDWEIVFIDDSTIQGLLIAEYSGGTN